MTLIAVKSVSFQYLPETRIIENVSLAVEEREAWAIIGRNGMGKSTLLKCIGGLLHVKTGIVEIAGKPVAAYHPIELAKRIAYVPQAGGRALPPYTAKEFVMLGRFPYQGFFSLPSKSDKKTVEAALQLTDTETLADRLLPTLSGGELQRVFLASAVAQQTGILLLDEPMAFLDPAHQEMIQRSIDRIREEFGTTIIAVTHDINHALGRFSHVCGLVNGSPFFAGTSAAFKERAPELLLTIFSIAFSELRSGDGRFRYYHPESLS